MSAITNQPSTTDFMNPNGFKFLVKKLPNVNYFCQSARIPSVSLSVITQPTSLSTIPRPGNKLSYESLILTVKVDEDLANYTEVYNWMVGLGHPSSLEQTYNLSAAASIPNNKIGMGSSFVSDASLIILSHHKNPKHSITFTDLFPYHIGELEFASTNSDVDYLQCTITFAYQQFTLERLDE